MLIPDRSEAEERAVRALLDGSYRTGDQAADLMTRDLLSLPLSKALGIIAAWLDDCDNHLALRCSGGLPPAPFNLLEAAVVLRMASGEKPYTGPVKPSALRLLARVADAADPRGAPVKGGADWWAMKALVSEGLAQVVGVAGPHRAPKLFVIATGRGQAVRNLHA